MLRPPRLIYEGTSLNADVKLQEGEFTSLDLDLDSAKWRQVAIQKSGKNWVKMLH